MHARSSVHCSTSIRSSRPDRMHNSSHDAWGPGPLADQSSRRTVVLLLRLDAEARLAFCALLSKLSGRHRHQTPAGPARPGPARPQQHDE
ncbi:hypothetical protein HU200_015411 [Digitaria exilis]|uniref:Uncharacterized protein n=1 Tax=Digitaria exilis TaxID=1010633 RepID=A0A835KM65_9POAL|nr:hypothetical protein HU200_015411 [Digitaria exilis]